MKNYKNCVIMAIASVCMILSVSAQPEKNSQPVRLVLKFKKNQSENYRLQTVSQRKVSIGGAKPDNLGTFQGGQTTDKIEMVFNQAVQSIDADGNAIEKITIKELKYFAEIRDRNVLNFDSTKDKDPNNALIALIGKSYSIEITPSGKVSKVLDVNAARAAVENIPSNKEAALRLLSDKTIERNHSVPLPDINDNNVSTGGKWSDVTTFDFGLLGVKSYKRAYKLDKIEEKAGSVYAIAGMDAIPSVAGTKENYQEQGGPVVLPMTDVRQTYSGQMDFDVTSGTLIKYDESLKNEWLVVPPSTNQSGPPLSLNMTANQSYNIEKIK